MKPPKRSQLAMLIVWCLEAVAECVHAPSGQYLRVLFLDEIVFTTFDGIDSSLQIGCLVPPVVQPRFESRTNWPKEKYVTGAAQRYSLLCDADTFSKKLQSSGSRRIPHAVGMPNLPASLLVHQCALLSPEKKESIHNTPACVEKLNISERYAALGILVAAVSC